MHRNTAVFGSLASSLSLVGFLESERRDIPLATEQKALSRLSIFPMLYNLLPYVEGRDN